MGTTVLFRNVLATSKRSDLCMLLNNQGFRGQYDFLYVPANFKTMLSFGYAFVNFVSGQAAGAALIKGMRSTWSGTVIALSCTPALQMSTNPLFFEEEFEFLSPFQPSVTLL